MLNQDVILEMNAQGIPIGHKLYAIVEEAGKYVITIEKLYAILE